MTKGTLLRNNRLLGALALTVLVAALTVTRLGTQTAFPTRDEVETAT